MKSYAIAILLALGSLAQADDTLRFTIRQFLVQGNTVLPQAEIDAALRAHAGEQRDFGDVQRALETLEALYRRAGFGSLQVYLPEQELRDGEVVFQVIEPKLDQVRIEGNLYFGAENIRRALPALQSGQIPNTGAMGASLRLANESPSRRLSVALQAGSQPQSVDALVRVQDEKPWRAFLAADNTGSEETGRTRLSLGYQHANLFDRDQVLTAQFTTAPEAREQVKIFGLGYKLPLYGWGDSLSAFAGYSNVSSGALQGLFNVSGKGTVAGARYNLGLKASGAYQHKLVLGIDWRRFENETTFFGFRQGKQQYFIQPLSLAYQVQSQGSGWSYDWNLSYARNLPHGDDLARASGRPGTPAQPIDNDDYQLLRFGANGYLGLPQEWLLRTSLNGQLSPDALPSGEWFGLGGASSVRGYQERVLANDEGVNASVELYTPDLARRLDWTDTRLQLLSFADWGRLSRNQPLPGELRSAKLASAGLGLRLNLGKYAQFKLDWARALKEGGGQRKGDSEAHASAMLSY